jgi:hypothetical protein
LHQITADKISAASALPLLEGDRIGFFEFALGEGEHEPGAGRRIAESGRTEAALPPDRSMYGCSTETSQKKSPSMRERVSSQSPFYSLFALSQKAVEQINAHCLRRSVQPLFKLNERDEAMLATFAT